MNQSNDFKLKATVMLVVTGVWAVYMLAAIIRGETDKIDLAWVGLPGAIFFALFTGPASIRRGGNNHDRNNDPPGRAESNHQGS